MIHLKCHSKIWLALALVMVSASCVRKGNSAPEQNAPPPADDSSGGESVIVAEEAKGALPTVLRPNGPSLELGWSDPSHSFVNYSPVDRSVDLNFDFKVNNHLSCDAKVFCSHVEGLWAPCSKEGSAKFVLQAREILTGFQRLRVQAQCGDEVSNTIELSWFGVSPRYANLSLDLRRIRTYAHYRLERSADCPGKLHFECRDGDTATFATCSNLKDSPAKTFEIKAVCNAPAGVSEGPVFRAG